MGSLRKWAEIRRMVRVNQVREERRTIQAEETACAEALWLEG